MASITSLSHSERSDSEPALDLTRGPHTTSLSGTGADTRLVDVVAAERAAAQLLTALGADLDSDGLRDTPRRMAAAYAELLTREPFNLTTFPNDEGYDELVLVRDIPFESECGSPARLRSPRRCTAWSATTPGPGRSS